VRSYLGYGQGARGSYLGYGWRTRGFKKGTDKGLVRSYLGYG
jgi:hypothetical protein